MKLRQMVGSPLGRVLGIGRKSLVNLDAACKARLESESPGVSDAAPRGPLVLKGVFRREDESWTVGIGGKALRLKDSKRMAYLAYLLRHPSTEFHVLDLFGGIARRSDENETNSTTLDGDDLEKAGIHIGGLGDAGELLDDQAKSAYRRRLSELREELAEAKGSEESNAPNSWRKRLMR
jgi:hypothetical protein